MAGTTLEYRTVIWGECHAALVVLDDVGRLLSEAERQRAAGRPVEMSEAALAAATANIAEARQDILRALHMVGGRREVSRLPPWSTDA